MPGTGGRTWCPDLELDPIKADVVAEGPAAADELGAAPEPYTTRLLNGWKCSYIKPQAKAIARHRKQLATLLSAQPLPVEKLPESSSVRSAATKRQAAIATAEKKRVRQKAQTAWEREQRTA